jgi:hypothetical protein
MAIIYDKKNDTYHGIRREAGKLGITPGHLSRFLRGERQSARLSKKVKIVEVK